MMYIIAMYLTTNTLCFSVTGHTINFVEVPDDQMYAALKGAGEKFATTLVAMYAAMREVGCKWTCLTRQSIYGYYNAC